MSKRVKGKDLSFISRIAPDGYSIEILFNMTKTKYLDEEILTLNRLSITEDTYIASGFNSYVVKIKKQENG